MNRLRTDTFASCTAGYRDLFALTPRQRSIVALTVLEADIYNGGFFQFIANRVSTSPAPRWPRCTRSAPTTPPPRSRPSSRSCDPSRRAPKL